MKKDNNTKGEGKKKYYPCQYCKATGIIERGEYSDYQQISPDIDCGNCEGKGYIEVHGKRHKEIVALRIGTEIITFNEAWKEDGIPYYKIVALGKKALKLI